MDRRSTGHRRPTSIAASAPYDSYAYDDDGYPTAQSFHFSFGDREPYDRGWIGHQDW